MTDHDVPDAPGVPDWLLVSAPPAPRVGGSSFLRRTSHALCGVIRSMRRAPERPHGPSMSPPVRLALALSTIAFVSAARSFLFVEIVGVALLALLATFEPRKLARVLALPAQAFLMALVIMAPSLFWSQTRAFIVTPTKALVTTTSLSLLVHSMNWNRFTCAFKSFGAPDALVFIFDLTLKYVVVFSEICLETIEAATLRSVGRDRRPARTFGGILGGVFLRTQDASREQFDAMTCRCFSGVYRRYRAPLRKADVVGVLLILAVAAAFTYLELASRCLI